MLVYVQILEKLQILSAVMVDTWGSETFIYSFGSRNMSDLCPNIFHSRSFQDKYRPHGNDLK